MKVKSSILTAVMVAALALSVGCGDNDNDDNDNGGGGNPTPTRTATPVAPTATPTGGGPTATPTPVVGENVDVIFTFTSTAPLQGYQINVAYPSAKGGFEGEADAVNCVTDVPAQFIKNNQVASSTLTLVIASSSNLTFPNIIECVFVQNGGQTLAASDLTVTVVEVTENGQAGDPNDLSTAITLTTG